MRDREGTFQFKNTIFGITSGILSIQPYGTREVSIGTSTNARVGVGSSLNASHFFLSVGDEASLNYVRINNDLLFYCNLSALGGMSVPGAGRTISKGSASTDSTLIIKDFQTIWESRNDSLRCISAPFDPKEKPMFIQDNGVGDVSLNSTGRNRNSNRCSSFLKSRRDK